MEKSLHVYVCSTYRDLVNERNAVMDGMENLTNQFSSLTYYCPRSIQPISQCNDEIGRCQLMILIVGHLQGVIAPGLDISHGEAEYNEGISQGKKILVYFRDENVGIYPLHFERDKSKANFLKIFKEKLARHHSPKIFQDLTSLTKLITEDVSDYSQKLGLNVLVATRNSKYKSKTSVTRAVPLVTGAYLLPQDKSEPQTQTIPIYQKALATPFQRRSTTSGKGPMYAVGGVLILALAVVGFSKYSKHAIQSRALSTPISMVQEKPTLQTPQNSGNNLVGPNSGSASTSSDPANATPAEPKPTTNLKSISAVIMMDDNDSIKAFMGKALNGTAAEQYRLAEMFELGKDVKQNDSLSLRWYKRSAEKGYTEAQYKLGLIYRNGTGVPKNSFQAARWFEQAANQGDARAQVKIGQMYQAGKGVRRNESVALKWFLKAADQKNPDAEKIIAEIKAN